MMHHEQIWHTKSKSAEEPYNENNGQRKRCEPYFVNFSATAAAFKLISGLSQYSLVAFV